MRKIFMVLSGVILCFFTTQLKASQLFSIEAKKTLENFKLNNDETVEHEYNVLADGNILIFKKVMRDYQEIKLYDTKKNLVTMTGSLQNRDRDQCTITSLKNGKVLVAGGGKYDASQLSAEVYDPSTGQWTMTQPLCAKRYGHHAVLLKNDKVLVFGGDEAGCKVEIYNPDTGAWTKTTPLLFESLLCKEILLLKSGKVLLFGELEEFFATSKGEEESEDFFAMSNKREEEEAERSIQVYDPKTEIWTKTLTIHHGKLSHATELNDGRVLLVVKFS